MNLFGDLFAAVVVAFGILFGISLLLWWMIRGLVLWYFRIDEIVGLLEKIERNTRSDPKAVYTETTNKTLATVPSSIVSSSITVPAKPASVSGRKCRECGAELPRAAEFCPKCTVRIT